MHGGDEVTSAAEVSELEKHAKHERKQTSVLPHLDGQFLMITHTDTGTLTGVLDLTQHGKHIKGTLTNPGQPPGTFKAKILIARSTEVKMTGKVVNRYVDSDPLKFESDPFDPDDWPDPDDDPFPEPPIPIEGDWGDPFDNIPDPLPPLPDFEIEPMLNEQS